MSFEHSTKDSIPALAERFESHFRERLRPIRKVGREAEFPVVTADGRAGDVNLLWEPLLAEGGFTPLYDNPVTRTLLVGVERDDLNIAVEVGRGTIELSLGPYDDLWQLQSAFEGAIKNLAQLAEVRGLYLLGYGIQPRTRPGPAIMTPRPRYHALYHAIGKAWLNLTTTASDQTHVDISRAELLDAINWMNLLSGPIIALCANSPIHEGRDGKNLAGREGLLRDLGEFRYGMTPHRFTSLEDFIRYLCDYVCFVLPNETGFEQVNRTLTDYLAEHPDVSFDQFLWHEHYVWNSARARIHHSTIEVRPACQQPPGESLAANALILGFVESLPQVSAFMVDALGRDPWPTMQAYRRAAVRRGLEAGEPVPGFIRGLVQIAEGGLARRRGGEEKFLIPIWNRLERCMSPGRYARQIVHEQGIAGLIESLRVRPDA